MCVRAKCAGTVSLRRTLTTLTDRDEQHAGSTQELLHDAGVDRFVPNPAQPRCGRATQAHREFGSVRPGTPVDAAIVRQLVRQPAWLVQAHR